MKYIKTFEKKNETDIKLLTELVEEFRKSEEEYYEWEEYKTCFKGTCHHITEDLKNILEKNGFEVKRVRGYYLDVADNFEPNMEDWDWKDRQEYEGHDGAWQHWWLVVNNKYIVDVTSDQFHPNDEDNYRVIITDIKDKNYTTKRIK